MIPMGFLVRHMIPMGFLVRIPPLMIDYFSINTITSKILYLFFLYFHLICYCSAR